MQHRKSYTMTTSLAIDYGDLTLERFIKEFSIMSGDVGILREFGLPDYSLMGIMDKFNGYFPQSITDYNTFIDGPDIEVMNTRFNELFNSKDSFLRTIFKDEQGNFRFRESVMTSEGYRIMKTSIKSWLSQYWTSLKGYNGVNEDIKSEDAFLENLLYDKPETYNDLDIGDSTTLPSEMRDLRKYAQSPQEAVFAQEVFSSALRLLGQGTIRLIFSNMMDYYGDNFGTSSNIRLKPLTRTDNLFECWAYLGLISATNLGKVYSGRQDLQKAMGKIFSMMFLDSYMYIPLKNYENSDINILKFPMGALVGAGPGLSSGSTQWYFRQDLVENFLTHYNQIGEKNKYSSFISSQEILAEILVDKAYDKLVNPARNTAEDKYSFDVIRRETERQLLTLSLHAVSSGLRVKINKFALSHESSLQIDLGTLIGIPATVELNQDDFIDTDFRYMPNIDMDFRVKNRIFTPIIQDRVDLLTKAIQAFHGDGRARIIPLVDSIDLQRGSQFLQPRESVTALKRFKMS